MNVNQCFPIESISPSDHQLSNVSSGLLGFEQVGFLRALRQHSGCKQTKTKKQLQSVCSLEVTISVSLATSAFTLTSESVAWHGEIRRLYFHRPLQHQLFGVLPALLQSDPRAERSLHGRDFSRSASSEILPWEVQRGEEGGGLRNSVSPNVHLCCCCPTD